MCCKSGLMVQKYILFNTEAYFYCIAYVVNLYLCFDSVPFTLKWNQSKINAVLLLLCWCSVFPTQQDKGEEASGSTNPAPLNQPPPPSRPTHRWHVIARHWLRQTRRRTSGVLPVTTRKSRKHIIPAHRIKDTVHTQGFYCLSVAETHFSWSNTSTKHY